jgi:predicted aldo/keto reductase-like oxidoreductase
MRYRTLGRTGIKVSTYALGAMMFGAIGNPDHDDSIRTDEILDRIDEIVPPGTDVGTLDMAYRPPALQQPSLRRRPAGERAAT